MQEIDELCRRIARLEATNAIERLAHAYNVSVDTHDAGLLPRIFSRSARILFAGQASGQAMPRKDEKDAGLAQKKSGLEGIIDMYQTLWDNLGPSCHWVHGHLIDFDEADGSRATGRAHHQLPLFLQDKRVSADSLRPRSGDDGRHAPGRRLARKATDLEHLSQLT